VPALPDGTLLDTFIPRALCRRRLTSRICCARSVVCGPDPVAQDSLAGDARHPHLLGRHHRQRRGRRGSPPLGVTRALSPRRVAERISARLRPATTLLGSQARAAIADNAYESQRLASA
jgi:hypothetical protein